MICVNDHEWARRLVVLRGWGRESSLFGEKETSEQLKNRFYARLDGIPYDAKFIFSEIGYNFLPLELSSAFALVQLEKLSKFVSIRRKNFARLYRFYRKYEKFFILPRQTAKSVTAWLAFPLIIKDSAPFTRREITEHLERANIQTRPIFTGNIVKQPGFDHIPHKKAQMSYPNTERVMRNGFVVGCHQGLTSKQLSYLEQQVTSFLNQYESHTR